MTPLQDRFQMLPAIAAGALALLSVMLVTVHPAHAQSSTTSCTPGGAVPDAANNPGLVSDCEALLAARDTLAGSATLNWSADTPITEWEGVRVSGTTERVTRLDLHDKGLTGAIPAGLGSLSNLEQLELGSNQLSGEIPSELGDLISLEWLYLDINQLTGQIPAELGRLSNLQELWLSINQVDRGDTA